MKQTDYFRRRVVQQRPYIRLARCEKAAREPELTEIQPDGRVRHWLFVPELGKYLRVVTLVGCFIEENKRAEIFAYGYQDTVFSSRPVQQHPIARIRTTVSGFGNLMAA